MKKIAYIVGDLSYPNGMSRVLSQKVNYLAEHTNYELYVVLTEKASKPWYYQLNPRVKHVNFDLNFDDLYQLPLHRRLIAYRKKQKKYRQLLTDYLMEVRPNITVSVMRREINFINDIQDGSCKVGEIHFNKQTYRVFEKRWLPGFVCRTITRRWQGALEREIRRLSKFVVLTHEDFNYWQGFSNITVIPNPIYTYPDHGSSCTSKQAIAVGRYTYQKGFDLLIEAWTQVAKRHPDWTLRIYGAGEPEAYRRLVSEKGLEGTVCCEDATNDVYSKYDESSIFVLSSRYEGLPLVLIEAMSAGLPCVAFTCPCGPRDCIDDGKDGILVEAGNTAMLADGICRLIENDDMRKAYGASARQHALQFREENIMHRWVELFEGL
jgi:glycosyltransferase involved in cell wall biosynthesis